MLRISKFYPAGQVSICYALLTAIYMLALPGVAKGKLLLLLLARAAVLWWRLFSGGIGGCAS
jgi:hypothetical protein